MDQAWWLAPLLAHELAIGAAWPAQELAAQPVALDVAELAAAAALSRSGPSS